MFKNQIKLLWSESQGSFFIVKSFTALYISATTDAFDLYINPFGHTHKLKDSIVRTEVSASFPYFLRRGGRDD